MKVNLSIDEKNFKESLIELRKRLEYSKENGILDDNYDKDIKELQILNNSLLNDLIPYYRKYGNNRLKLEIKQMEVIGSFMFESFAENILKIDENLFIISRLDGKVQFGYLYVEENKIEWANPIKNINTRMSHMFISEKKLFMIGVGRKSYVMDLENINNLDDIINLNFKESIEEIVCENDIDGFGKTILIENNILLAGNDEDKLSIIKIDRLDNKYIFKKLEKEVYIKNWSCLYKFDGKIIIGDKNGNIFVGKYEEDNFMICNEYKIMNNSIANISLLENEKDCEDKLMLYGEGNICKIIDLKDMEIMHDWEFNENIIDVKSKKGTAAMLSETGKIYVIEENFDEWETNNIQVTGEDIFTNLIEISSNKYLAIDIDSNCKNIILDRITKISDFNNKSIY